MKYYQREFIQFAIQRDVLRFGEFTLKSGRVSPYFFNAGLFSSGATVARLGRFYAQTLMQHEPGDYMLFGPAYKGIPLATATAIALADRYDRDMPFAFNRKEAKDHGEGGRVVGAPLAGRVIIIDDVITAGTSVGESVKLIRAAGAEPAGVVIAVDRQEQAGDDGKSAVTHVRELYGMPVYSIVTIDDVVHFLSESRQYRAVVDSINSYRQRFGAG
jgi:orotate phosphoribosyltransferase